MNLVFSRPQETEAPQVRPSALLAGKLAALRRKHVSSAVLTGLALAVSVGFELLALALFADWWLDLPWGARLALLLAQIAIFGTIVARFVLVPLLHRPNDDELALMVERARPKFRSRLIASIQLTRPGTIPTGASPVMVEAMVEQTEAMAAPMNFAEIVPTDKLKKLGTLAVIVTVLAGFVLAVGGPDVRDLLKRAFLSNVPVPRKTRVLVPDGHKVIGRGDSVRLEAYAQGIIPRTGKLEVQFRGRRTQEFPLEQDRDNRAHFGRTLDNVQDSFDYVIQLNDGLSETFTVRALPRPTVVTIECEQRFPAYTQLQPVRRSLGDLTLLAGSVLQVKVAASKEIQSGSIKPVVSVVSVSATNAPIAGQAPPVKGIQASADALLQVSVTNRKELLGQLTIPASGLSGFSIQMLDTESMESRDAAVYRIEILPDKAPIVRITYPERKEELYTRQAIVLVGFEATDDFGNARVRLRYKSEALNNGEEGTLEMDLGGEQPARLRRRYEWKLSDFNPPLPEGSVVEYWIEAADNNNATGPGVGTSERQFAKIVSEADKRADLLNRAGDYIGSVNDVATDQEKVSRNLGAIIREKATLK